MPKTQSIGPAACMLLFLLGCDHSSLSPAQKADAALPTDAEVATCSATLCGGQCVDIQTDKQHCGGCDTLCTALSPSIAECVSGRCLVTLDYSQRDAWSIAVDDANVYWTYLSYPVMKIPIEGGTATRLVASGGQAVGLAVSGTDVYWTDFTGQSLMRVPKGGGSPVILGSSDVCQNPDAIAVDATNIYWVNTGSAMFVDGTIMEMPLAGGSPVTLATEQTLPMDIAVFGTNVYWLNDGGAVMKVASDGKSAPTMLHATDNCIPRSIAVDGTTVYWTKPDDGTVMQVSVAGGDATALVTGQGGPYGIAVDESYVYWTNRDAGTVMKLAKGGGTPITMASGQGRPFDIAVDRTSIYWTNVGDGRVMKLRPK